MNDIIDSEPHRHILSVVLEDYCHVASVRRVVPRGYWHRFESRVQHNTLFSLDLLDEMKVKATFFALGWIADHQPDVIKEVVRRGHEIASKGYFHRSIRQMSPEEFREDAIMSRKALERASGTEVRGYRIATDWFTRKDLWALDILCEEGFSYDTSIRVLGTEFSDEPFRRFPHLHKCESGKIWEVPLSSSKFGPFCVPFSGGNYVRQLPDSFVRKAVANWDRNIPAPLFFYFHIWELDPDQPRITAAARLQRVRHYRNLDVMLERVRFYLSQYQFSPVADYLKLPAPKVVEHYELEKTPSISPVNVSARPANLKPPLPISLVVLHQKLATYTSRFRVYRASVVKNMRLRYDGFVGITGILSQLDMKGIGVVECPAVMEVRLLEHSKIRNLETIRGHLALLAHLVAERVSRQFRPQQLSQTGEVP